MVKPIDVNKYNQDFVFDIDPPMPSWRWMAKFDGPDIPGVDWNTLLVETVTLPNGEILAPQPSFGGGRTRNYPDFPEVSSITVGIYETEDGVANLSLSNWKEAVKSSDGWYGLPVNYKGSLTVNMFGYSSNSQPVMTYFADGVWPSDAGSFDLNYTDDNRLILQATFSCDFIIKSNRK